MHTHDQIAAMSPRELNHRLSVEVFRSYNHERQQGRSYCESMRGLADMEKYLDDNTDGWRTGMRLQDSDGETRRVYYCSAVMPGRITLVGHTGGNTRIAAAKVCLSIHHDAWPEGSRGLTRPDLTVVKGV